MVFSRLIIGATEAERGRLGHGVGGTGILTGVPGLPGAGSCCASYPLHTPPHLCSHLSMFCGMCQLAPLSGEPWIRGGSLAARAAPSTVSCPSSQGPASSSLAGTELGCPGSANARRRQLHAWGSHHPLTHQVRVREKGCGLSMTRCHLELLPPWGGPSWQPPFGWCPGCGLARRWGWHHSSDSSGLGKGAVGHRAMLSWHRGLPFCHPIESEETDPFLHLKEGSSVM